MQISNGAGGLVSLAGVDPKNRLLTYSTTREESLSHTYDGRSYSVLVKVTPETGTTYFFMLGTNTSDYPVVVNQISLTCETVDHVDVFVGAYVAPTVTGPTPDMPVNKNVAIGKACPWTANVGTTLATTAILKAMDSIPVGPNKNSVLTDSIILQPGSCLALKTAFGGQDIRGSVHFYLLDNVKTGSWVE